MNASGKRGRQNPDWFTAGIANLEPAIAAKRAALLDYKREASDKTLAALRRATNDAQRDRPPPRQRLLAESLSEQPTLRLGLKTWRGEDRVSGVPFDGGFTENSNVFVTENLDTVQPWLLWILPLPKERVVLFFEAAA